MCFLFIQLWCCVALYSIRFHRHSSVLCIFSCFISDDCFLCTYQSIQCNNYKNNTRSCGRSSNKLNVVFIAAIQQQFVWILLSSYQVSKKRMKGIERTYKQYVHCEHSKIKYYFNLRVHTELSTIKQILFFSTSF